MPHPKLSHSRKQRFKCTFQNCLNPLFGCGLDIESISHSLFFLSNFYNIDCEIFQSNAFFLTKRLALGSALFDIETQTLKRKDDLR